MTRKQAIKKLNDDHSRTILTWLFKEDEEVPDDMLKTFEYYKNKRNESYIIPIYTSKGVIDTLNKEFNSECK